MAFHTSHNAMSFALEAQQALLRLPWPYELVQHSCGKEVYVVPASNERWGVGPRGGGPLVMKGGVWAQEGGP